NGRPWRISLIQGFKSSPRRSLTASGDYIGPCSARSQRQEHGPNRPLSRANYFLNSAQNGRNYRPLFGPIFNGDMGGLQNVPLKQKSIFRSAAEPETSAYIAASLNSAPS